MFGHLIAALALSSPGAIMPSPQDAPSAPVARMRMMSPGQFDLRWFGVGELRASANLCVTSSTGRFYMDVLPFQLSSGTATPPKYEITVKTLAGDSQTLQSSNGTMTFTGRAVGDDCHGTPNVTVELRFLQRDLTASLAGQYLEQLQINVRPA